MKKKSSGFSLLEMVFIIATTSFLIAYEMQQNRREHEQAKAKALGQEIAMYNNAVRAYIAEHAQEIVVGDNLGNPAIRAIHTNDLRKKDSTCGPNAATNTATHNFLPCDFPSTTTLGGMPFGIGGITNFKVFDNTGNLLDVTNLPPGYDYSQPRIIAETIFPELILSQRKRSDLAGLAALTAMGYAVPGSVSQKLIAGGADSSHAAISIIPGSAQIKIESNNHLHNDDWLHTDGYNNMQEDIRFALNTTDNPINDEDKEIVGMNRARNIENQDLELGANHSAIATNSSNIYIDANFFIEADSVGPNPSHVSLYSGNIFTNIAAHNTRLQTAGDNLRLSAGHAPISVTGNIVLDSDNAFALSSKSNGVSINAQGEVIIDTEGHNFFNSQVQDITISAEHGSITATSDHIHQYTSSENSSLQALDGDILSISEDILFESTQTLDMQARDDILYQADKDISLQTQNLEIKSNQQAINMESGKDIGIASHSGSVSIHANNGNFTTKSSGRIVMADPKSIGLVYDESSLYTANTDNQIKALDIRSNQAQIKANGAIQYYSGDDISQSETNSSIEAYALNGIWDADALNFTASNTDVVIFDIQDGGRFDINGKNGLDMQADMLYLNATHQVLISGGPNYTSAPNNSSIGLYAMGGDLAISSDKSLYAEGQAMQIAAGNNALFEQTDYFMQAQDSIAANTSNFRLKARTSLDFLADNKIKFEGENFQFNTTSGPIYYQATNTNHIESLGKTKVDIIGNTFYTSPDLTLEADNWVNSTAKGSYYFKNKEANFNANNRYFVEATNRLDLRSPNFTTDTPDLNFHSALATSLYTENQHYHSDNLILSANNIELFAQNDLQVHVAKDIVINSMPIEMVAGDSMDFVSKKGNVNIGTKGIDGGNLNIDTDGKIDVPDAKAFNLYAKTMDFKNINGDYNFSADNDITIKTRFVEFVKSGDLTFEADIYIANQSDNIITLNTQYDPNSPPAENFEGGYSNGINPTNLYTKDIYIKGSAGIHAIASTNTQLNLTNVKKGTGTISLSEELKRFDIEISGKEEHWGSVTDSVNNANTLYDDSLTMFDEVKTKEVQVIDARDRAYTIAKEAHDAQMTVYLNTYERRSRPCHCSLSCDSSGENCNETCSTCYYDWYDSREYPRDLPEIQTIGRTSMTKAQLEEYEPAFKCETFMADHLATSVNHPLNGPGRCQ